MSDSDRAEYIRNQKEGIMEHFSISLNHLISTVSLCIVFYISVYILFYTVYKLYMNGMQFLSYSWLYMYLH